LSHGYITSLTNVGVDVRAFGRPGRFKNRFQINFRNHRKIVIVDGRVGLTGGHNVGDEYLGLSQRFGFWRDTHIRLTGPAVMALQEVFLENWYWVTGETPELQWTPESSGEDVAVMVVPSGPGDDLEICSLFFIQLLNSSQERAWITSPYFVPNEAVLEALILAALRGVDVRIIIPKKPDKWTVWFAAFAYMKQALSAGVKFYRYEKGFLHQKVMLVDDSLAVVGTANLDNRSFRLNFELSVLINDDHFAARMDRMLQDDFANSHQISIEEASEHSLLGRIAIAGSRLLSPIL
jgi:cardiolipin synthase